MDAGKIFDTLLGERGMRASDLAEKSGITASTVYAITSGRTQFEKIGIGTFVKLAQGLDLSSDELYEEGRKINGEEQRSAECEESPSGIDEAGYSLALKDMRTEAGMTQQEVAEAAGVPLSTYRSWEQGVAKKFSLGHAFVISGILGCSPNDLCGWKEKDSREDPSAASKTILDGAYALMSDETREMVTNLAVSIICDPARRRK